MRRITKRMQDAKLDGGYLLAGKTAAPIALEAVNRRGRPERVVVRFATLTSNGDEPRGAILMMEASDA
ncbi:MAG TPA: hypothetical protein VFL60_04900 [Gaiellaceae bacterium]|nr:hypothetical protein [Gaiellaceae bacterium]